MKPQSPGQDDLLLFQAHFDQLLNPAHPLLKLAGQIDWAAFDDASGELYCEDNGAPAVQRIGRPRKWSWPSGRRTRFRGWQAFCGFTHMQHALPVHPTSMTKWRKRISGGGAEKLEALLKQTVAVAVEQKHLPQAELRQVNVDTTVQEKNITHPTDAKLLYRAIVKLAAAAKDRGIALRQSYVRVADGTDGWL